MHPVRIGIVALAALTVFVWPGRLTALDPHKAVTQYAHQVWKTDAGLPQNSIQSILQTRDGYLWLGTERGLVRFDGVQFTVFDKGNTPGLRNSNAQTLFQDRAGDSLGRDVGRAPPVPGREVHLLDLAGGADEQPRALDHAGPRRRDLDRHGRRAQPARGRKV